MTTVQILSALVAVATFTLCVQGHPEYIALIPNGLNLVDPCNPNITAHGVGHINPDGAGPLNPFGMDFVAECRKWTQELCQKDSDGDGLTNGQELGDPDCVWSIGLTPALSTGLSHPGVNEKTVQC
ncbi:hypothetical protein EGW08_015467 [Elysia chlorotica]|uniref:Temptin Cys/Cys disulfide domain-containing protein n=1 Tax=Elysia chlorotica TaxID=188477 RepID=A0A3S1BWL3_ELYCH|nr:hypothetical protein EGW08_015467 [Elysia chlorotica]